MEEHRTGTDRRQYVRRTLVRRTHDEEVNNDGRQNSDRRQNVERRINNRRNK